MITQGSLFVLDRFRWVFVLLSVDYIRLRQILWAKLTMDNRRDYLTANPETRKESKNTFLLSLFIYGIIGLFAGLTLAIFHSLFLSATLVHGVIMCMAAISLISDFTSVLIDTTDNAVLMCRPIDNRTMVTARVTHIFIYLFSLILALSLVSFVAGVIKHGLIFIPAFGLSLVFTALFTVFATNLVYLALMRFTSGEKFRDIINYFQIVVVVLILLGFHILPRIIDIESYKQMTISVHWWTYLIPPVWMGGMVDVLAGWNFSPDRLLLLLLAVAIPLGCIVLVVRVMAPGFARRLARLDIEKQSGHGAEVKQKQPVYSILSRMVCRRREERASFDLLWRIGSTDRKFKLKVYPTIGYVLVFLYLFFLQPAEDQSFSQNLKELTSSNAFLFPLYLCAMLPCMAIPLLAYHDNFTAGWIFQVLPFQNPGTVRVASVKMIVVKLLLPFYLVFSVAVLIFWGVHTFDDIVFGLINVVFISLLAGMWLQRSYPFSKSYTTGDVTGRIILAFLVFLLGFVLAGVHYLLLKTVWSVWTAIPVMVLFAMLITYWMRNHSINREVPPKTALFR